MAAIVKVYSTTASKVNQLSVVDGQLIFVKDTRKICLDMNGVRVEYSDIQVLQNEATRQGLLAPIEGFYFVEDTAVMWRYKGGWTQISPSNLEPLVFGDLGDFPEKGSPTTLYVSDNATYKWDSATQTYVMVANKTEWENISA